MTKMTEEQIFARMSGHFLCQHLPDDWADWPEEKLDKFFEDNAWEPFEYWDVHDMYELIDCLTRDVMNLMGVDGTDQLL